MPQCLANPSRRGVEHRQGRGEGGPCPLHEHRHAIAAGTWIGGSDRRHRSTRQSRRGGDGLLQIGCVEGTAADEDDVLVAAGDAQSALVQETEVARAQPAGAERGHAGFGGAVIAACHLRSAYLDVTDPPVVHRVPGIVGHPELALRDGTAHIHQFHGVRAGFGRDGAAPAEGLPVQSQGRGDLPERGHRHGERGLGQSVHGEHGRGVQSCRTGLGAEVPPHARCDRLGTDEHQAYAAQVQCGPGAVRHSPCRERQREVRCREQGGAVPVHRFEPAGGALGEGQRFQSYLLQACSHGDQVGAYQTHVVEVRHPARQHVVRRDRHGGADLPEVGEHGLMGEFHALRGAGAAGGELEKGEVLRLPAGQRAQRAAFAQRVQPQRAHRPRNLGEQGAGGGGVVNDDGGPAEELPHRPHATRLRGERHRHEPRRQRSPEHRLEILAAIREQRNGRAGLQPRLAKPSRHAQCVVAEFGEGDGVFAAVSPDMYDDLAGCLLRGVQQHVEERGGGTAPGSRHALPSSSHGARPVDAPCRSPVPGQSVVDHSPVRRRVSSNGSPAK